MCTCSCIRVQHKTALAGSAQYANKECSCIESFSSVIMPICIDEIQSSFIFHNRTGEGVIHHIVIASDSSVYMLHNLWVTKWLSSERR